MPLLPLDRPPGLRLVEGEWDLRGGELRYLGGVELTGKRALELGTADGFLGFGRSGRAPRWSLRPVAGHSIDVVPYARSDHEALRRELQEHVARLNRVLARHRAFGSDARLAHGTVYDIPGGLGEFDVTTLGSILLHLRDPFRALESAAARTRGTIVVTDRGAPRALRTPSVC